MAFFHKWPQQDMSLLTEREGFQGVKDLGRTAPFEAPAAQLRRPGLYRFVCSLGLSSCLVPQGCEE
jgi:hypothetical protein